MVSIVGMYVLSNWSDLLILLKSQLLSVHVENTSLNSLLIVVFSYISIYLLFLPLLVNKNTLKNKKLILCLFLSLPFIIYHLFTENKISFYKHLVYSIFFLVPVLVMGMRELNRRLSFFTRNMLFYLLFTVALCVSFFQIKSIETAFPNTEKPIALIKSDTDKSGPVLSENPYLLRHALYPIMDIANMHDIYTYDANKDGVPEKQELFDAVWDGYFEYIYLDGRFSPDITAFIRDNLVVNSYKIIHEEKYLTSGVMSGNQQGAITLYKRKP